MMELADVTVPKMSHINALLPHLYDMAVSMKQECASSIIGSISRIRSRILSAVISAKNGDKDAYCWPLPSELLTLRAVAKLYPVSDFRHPVSTPVFLMLGQILSQSPVRGPHDVLSCLDTISVALDFASVGDRFFPEALEALQSLFVHATAPHYSKNIGGPTFSEANLPWLYYEHVSPRIYSFS